MMRSVYHQWQNIHYGAIELNFEKIRADLEANPDNINALVKATPKNLNCELDQDIKCFNKIKSYFQKPIPPPICGLMDKTYGNNALMLMKKYNDNQRETPEYKRCYDLLIESGIIIYQRDSNGNPLNVNEPPLLPSVYFFGSSDEQILELLTDKVNNCGINSIIQIMDGRDNKSSSISLLQWCCKKGYSKSIDYMINHNVDLNTTIERNTKHPLLYLIKHGILFKKYLTAKYRDGTPVFRPEKLPKEILVTAMRKASNAFELISTILEYLRTDAVLDEIIQYVDNLGRTALHYAALFSSEQCFTELLKQGASLMTQDKEGKSALALLQNPSLLSIHLDNCVVIKNREFKSKSYNIKLDYTTLMERTVRPIVGDVDPEGGAPTDDEIVNETYFLEALCDKKLKHFFGHPLVETFIFIKWRKLQRIFWLYFLLSCSGCFCNYAGVYYYTENRLLDKFEISTHCFFAAFVLLAMVCLLELLIFGSKCWKNLQFIETFLIIASLICGLLLLNIDFDLFDSDELILSFITFLTTIKIFLMLQVHPRCTLNVLLLRRTAYHFFKMMIFYSLPFLAFSLCFHLLNPDRSKNFLITIFDTIIGFSGNVSNSDVDKFKENIEVARFVYVLFIFIIVIILNNLLSALAIKDSKEIYSDASFIEKKDITFYLLTFEKFANSKNLINRLLCNYLTQPKLFANNKYQISIYPNRKKNVGIGNDQRVSLDIKRAISSLNDYISNGKIFEEQIKSCVVCNFHTNIEDELKSIKELLNARLH